MYVLRPVLKTLIILVVSIICGCGWSIQYTSLKPSKSTTTSTKEIKVYSKGETIPDEYEVIGQITGNKSNAMGCKLSDTISRMKTKAAAQGGEALSELTCVPAGVVGYDRCTCSANVIVYK